MKEHEILSPSDWMKGRAGYPQRGMVHNVCVIVAKEYAEYYHKEKMKQDPRIEALRELVKEMEPEYPSLYDPRSGTGKYYPEDPDYIEKEKMWKQWYNLNQILNSDELDKDK
ncbi:hypothetical protein PP178_04195 [Zeaxanthinibacter sp. PT1]|uniref:hypothetical protein n=1 Tax=Zeaxanthinibacter TaxID=561554 RepID=UPI00234B3397|nr:hypothetical protein [Zeaxanthinibacter sp. PT1]MDC6350742.1 hypothetical protein [Zeaxanthinibacter sp. PT1]